MATNYNLQKKNKEKIKFTIFIVKLFLETAAYTQVSFQTKLVCKG